MALGLGPIWAKSETKLPDTYAFTRGVEAYQEGKVQEALEWFEKELSEHPDNGYAYIYISALKYENSEFGKALSAINLALKKLPKKDKEYMAVAYGTRAGIYLVMEDTVSALKTMALPSVWSRRINNTTDVGRKCILNKGNLNFLTLTIRK